MPSYLGYSRIGPISNFWFQRLSRLKFFSLLFSLFCEANLLSFLNTCCYGNPFIRRSGNTSPSHFNFGCLQFLKQKLKEQLQRTRQAERNKESRTLGLKAIAEWPFSSSKKSHFQSEAKCEAIETKMSFNYDANKTHFHNKGLALSLVLKVRILELRKGLLCRHGRIIYYSSK